MEGEDNEEKTEEGCKGKNEDVEDGERMISDKWELGKERIIWERSEQNKTKRGERNKKQMLEKKRK